MDFFQFINLHGQEIRNFLVQTLAGAPAEANDGRMYYDSGVAGFMGRAGGSWVRLDLQEITDMLATGATQGHAVLVGAGGTITTGALPSGVTDHGELDGLADDDHAQYALADGTRGAFATEAQGALADTSVQPADNITVLTNDAGFISDYVVTEADVTAHVDKALIDGLGVDAATLGGTTAAGFVTEAELTAEIDALVGAAPGTLDTLQELADALGDDPDFATTVSNQIAAKPDKFSASVGDGIATSIAVTHNLGTRDVIVQVFDNATFETVYCGVVRNTDNQVTLDFSEAPAVDAFRVVVNG